MLAICPTYWKQSLSKTMPSSASHPTAWRSLWRTRNVCRPMPSSRCVCFTYMIIHKLLLWVNTEEVIQLNASPIMVILERTNRSFLSFQAEIFQEFTIKEDLVGFQVNLTVLLDCLNIFGGSTVPGKDKRNWLESGQFTNFIFLAIVVLMISLVLLLQEYRQPCGCATRDMVTLWPCSWRRAAWWLCASSTRKNQKSQLTLSSAAPMSQTR